MPPLASGVKIWVALVRTKTTEELNENANHATLTKFSSPVFRTGVCFHILSEF